MAVADSSHAREEYTIYSSGSLRLRPLRVRSTASAALGSPSARGASARTKQARCRAATCLCLRPVSWMELLLADNCWDGISDSRIVAKARISRHVEPHQEVERARSPHFTT